MTTTEQSAVDAALERAAASLEPATNRPRDDGSASARASIDRFDHAVAVLRIGQAGIRAMKGQGK